jgi:hypothetical protein
LDHRPERLVRDLGVHLGGGKLPMPQSLLDQVEVPGLSVQPRRERVPQGVDRERASDARLCQQHGEVELDLPGAEATAGLGGENGRVGATGARIAWSLRALDQLSRTSFCWHRLGVGNILPIKGGDPALHAYVWSSASQVGLLHQ